MNSREVAKVTFKNINELGSFSCFKPSKGSQCV